MIFDCWDTHGSSEPYSQDYCQNASLALLMFDVGSKKSYEHIPKWFNDFKAICPNAVVILCGNKADKTDESRQVKARDIFFHRKKSLQYFDVSAKNGDNCWKPFISYGKTLYGEKMTYCPHMVIGTPLLERCDPHSYPAEWAEQGGPPTPIEETKTKTKVGGAFVSGKKRKEPESARDSDYRTKANDYIAGIFKKMVEDYPDTYKVKYPIAFQPPDVRVSKTRGHIWLHASENPRFQELTLQQIIDEFGDNGQRNVEHMLAVVNQNGDFWPEKEPLLGGLL